jgi:tetratricopeptide (TPR) repeat protein
MNDPQKFQDGVLHQLKSMKIAAWLVAVCLVVCTVVTIAFSLVYAKMLTGYKSQIFRPEYQNTLHTLLADGKYDEALRLALEKEAADPQDAYAWYSSGLAYYHMKDWTNALHDLQEAQTLSPTWEKGYTGPYIKTIEGILSDKKKRK